MSETVFNAYEVLRIATEMERDGLAFYEAMAGAVKDEGIKRLVADLADQERDHIRRFQKMIDAERFDAAWSVDDLQLIDDYLEATVKRQMFPGREAAKNIAGYVRNLDDALSLAIHMERMTVLYYEKLLAACTYDTGRKAFAQLVEEEKKHAASLEEARAALSQATAED
ncbi:MAG: ferritin-like domain-containing protein [Planctomycetota bacterium]